MANRTVREIERIKKYECIWKIKTNKNKFKLIPIAVIKTNEIIVEDNK